MGAQFILEDNSGSITINTDDYHNYGAIKFIVVPKFIRQQIEHSYGMYGHLAVDEGLSCPADIEHVLLQLKIRYSTKGVKRYKYKMPKGVQS